MKTFFDLINSVMTNLKLDGDNYRNACKSWINAAYKDFQMRRQWDWRLRTANLQLTAMYETGTVTATNGSRTVTGSGTSWTSAMVDRFIQINNDSDYYKIVSVTNGTELILDNPYIETTASSLSYKIWKRFYTLIPDIKEIYQIFTRDSIRPIPNYNFSKTVFGESTPTAYRKAENNIIKTTVTFTNNISCTKDSNVVTGSGTTFISDVQEGDKFYFNAIDTTKEFTVLKVISDTSLYLVQNAFDTINSGMAYIVRNDIMQIEFDYSPDETINVYYRYYRKAYSMLNDNDEPEMPEEYRDVLYYGAVIFAMQNLLRTSEKVGIEMGSKQMYEARIREITTIELNKADEGNVAWRMSKWNT